MSADFDALADSTGYTQPKILSAMVNDASLSCTWPRAGAKKLDRGFDPPTPRLAPMMLGPHPDGTARGRGGWGANLQQQFLAAVQKASALVQELKWGSDPSASARRRRSGDERRTQKKELFI